MTFVLSNNALTWPICYTLLVATHGVRAAALKPELLRQ
jgi:hypothetical protein